MTENKAPASALIDSNRPPSPAGRWVADIRPEQHLQLYYFLQLNRQLETRLERLFRQGKIVGGLYSSLGQEAISVGAAYALDAQDWLAPMIRNIGALLVKGVPPRDIFAQHLARATSPTHGKDGTSHFADLKTRHIVAPSSMLGDLIPVMTGVAMAGRYLGQKIVALTWIGDGGSSTGAFHEGMNLAAAQRAPLVVILENNQWAYSTPASRQVPLRDFAERAAAYGIRSSIVDGNDVLAVYRATKEAVAECRAGRGPWLIEAKTMRMKGHAQHDAAEYVPKEMLDDWKARDPIKRFSKYLTEHSLWNDKQKAEIDARVERELDAEQKFAEESPIPAPEQAAQGVYCGGCHTIEADWRRPKEEVTPPATMSQAKWKIADLGGITSVVPAAPHASVAPTAPPTSSAPTAPVTNAAIAAPAAKLAPATARTETPRSTQRAATPEPQPASAKPTEETPIRVPFGRGPKDKAFLQEHPQQAAKQHRPPHRHNAPKSGKRKR